ncbi:MAG: hypothetical protein M1839_004350 [Geoglossum umbratile]|nr:MAG: hypothetical protein M1839_004350 [Geoglossum umbratile]
MSSPTDSFHPEPSDSFSILIGTANPDQGYASETWLSFDNVGLPAPPASAVSSGHGYESSSSHSDTVGLLTPSNGTNSSGQGSEGTWSSPDYVAQLADCSFFSGQGRTADWLRSDAVDLLMPLDSITSPNQGYTGALPYSNCAESWQSSEDVNTPSPIDGNYTSHPDTTSTWANQDEDYSNARATPLSQNSEPQTNDIELDSWNSNADPLSEVLQQPTVPSIPLPEGQALMSDFYAGSLRTYDVLPQVSHHKQHTNTGISGVGGGVTSAGLPVPLDSWSPHPCPFPTVHSPGHIHPSSNLELSTSRGGGSSQVVLARVLTFDLVHCNPENPADSTVTYGPPLPRVGAAATRSRSSPSVTSSERQGKKSARRRGPLEAGRRRNAHAVRSHGACFVCRELKQACDPFPGPICSPCLARKTNQKVVRWRNCCDFTPMPDRWALMLPSYITGHLEDHEVEKYLANAGVMPVGNIVRVEWTWGFGPPLVVEMEEIITSLRRSSSFRLGADEGTHEHIRGGLVPLQIGEAGEKQIRQVAERYIPSIVYGPLKDFPEFHRSEAGGNEFQFRLLKAICWFHGTPQGKRSSEFTRALELFVLCFFMSLSLYLTPKSRRELGGSMWFWTDDPAEEYPTPGIALRQLKQRYRPKQEDLMKAALADFHGLCKRHDKPDWAIAFAILALFALICQDLQTSAMLGGIWEDENKEDERNGLPYNYTDARKCIKAMEDEVFDVLTESFELGYRNFNPLEGDFSEDAQLGLHKDSISFIKKVRRLVAEGKAEQHRVREREREEPIDKIPPRNFAGRNVSRLVLKLVPNAEER